MSRTMRRRLWPAALWLFLAPLAAQTPAPSGDLSGSWRFVLNAEDGPHQIDATFKVANGDVTGKWSEADVKGTYSDGQFDLAFPFTYQQAGLSGPMHLKGKLAEGKLSGTWEYAGYSGGFTATRPN